MRQNSDEDGEICIKSNRAMTLTLLAQTCL